MGKTKRREKKGWEPSPEKHKEKKSLLIKKKGGFFSHNREIAPTGGNFNKENVLLLKNEQATLKNVKLAITNFLKKAIDTDFVVIFMACHGEPEPDRPNNIYLLMHDSELDSLSATAYHMENVNAHMQRETPQ